MPTIRIDDGDNATQATFPGVKHERAFTGVCELYARAGFVRHPGGSDRQAVFTRGAMTVTITDVTPNL